MKELNEIEFSETYIMHIYIYIYSQTWVNDHLSTMATI